MISISILEADLMHLADEVDRSLLVGVDAIHVGYLDCGNEAAINYSLSISRSLRDYGVRIPISLLLFGNVTEQIIRLLVNSGLSYLFIGPLTLNMSGEILSYIKEA